MTQFLARVDHFVDIKNRILENLAKCEALPNHEDSFYGIEAILAFIDYVQPIWPKAYYYKVLEILERIKLTWAMDKKITKHIELLEFAYRKQ